MIKNGFSASPYSGILDLYSTLMRRVSQVMRFIGAIQYKSSKWNHLCACNIILHNQLSLKIWAKAVKIPCWMPQAPGARSLYRTDLVRKFIKLRFWWLRICPFQIVLRLKRNLLDFRVFILQIENAPFCASKLNLLGILLRKRATFDGRGVKRDHLRGTQNNIRVTCLFWRSYWSS